jgi:tetratricopeptide (TPR) repeat protein
MGRHDAAIAELRQAKQLDPDALIIQCDLAGAYAFARRYDEAAAECREALAKDRNFAMARNKFGWVLACQGKYEEAIAEFDAASQLDGHPRIETLLGYAYGSAGKTTETRRILQRLTDANQPSDVWPGAYAYLYLALGEKDQALAELERGFRERSLGMLFLIDPLFDPLRTEPRFQKIVADMKFPP